jgi:hypothetical protein
MKAIRNKIHKAQNHSCLATIEQDKGSLMLSGSLAFATIQQTHLRDWLPDVPGCSLFLLQNLRDVH